MDAALITAIITGLVTLIGSVTLAAISIIKALRENRVAISGELQKSQEIQSEIHTAVNSNYQAMLQKNDAQAQELKMQTAKILELSKTMSTLIERLSPPLVAPPIPPPPLPPVRP